MSVREKIETGIWFLRRPRCWAHASFMMANRLRSRDRPAMRRDATEWVRSRVVTKFEALSQIGLSPESEDELPRPPGDVMRTAEQLAASATVEMGGPGDLDLIYAAVVLARCSRAIESGVAAGWSSLAILSALDHLGKGQLVSVDMPYPKRNNEDWVGVVIPQHLRADWTLIREPDRFGLRRAVRTFGGRIDFCHYDSDKSYWGRKYGYRIMWNALSPGGIFISDDIQDNFAFREFMHEVRQDFAVTEYLGKYVGITRKLQ